MINRQIRAKAQDTDARKDALVRLAGDDEMTPAWWQALIVLHDEGRKMLADHKDGTIEVILRAGEPITVRGTWAVAIKLDQSGQAAPQSQGGLKRVK